MWGFWQIWKGGGMLVVDGKKEEEPQNASILVNNYIPYVIDQNTLKVNN